MRITFVKSIGFKMAIAMTLGLLAVMSIFSHFSIRSSEQGLLGMAESETAKISDAIKNSLENAMLSGDSGKTQAIMDAFGRESMVDDIKIMSVDGTIKLAKNKSEVGTKPDRSRIKGCTLCHNGNSVKKDNMTVVFEGDGGKKILRNVNIIRNRQECYSCHSAGKNVLGELMVDFSIADAERTVSDTRRILIVSALTTLIAAILISTYFFSRFVKKPLTMLLTDMDRVERGDLEAISIAQGSDEIAQLNQKFGDMVAAVRASNLKVKEQMDEFRTLFNVGEVLNRSDSIDEASNLVLNAISLGFEAEECAIMILNESGSVQTKSSIGLDAGNAGKLREFMESVFKAGLLQMLETEAGGEGGNPLASVSNRIAEGEVFVVSGSANPLDDFLVVPLRAAKRLLGIMSIHKMKGKRIREFEAIEDVKRLFMIVAMQVSPYFFIGLSIDEKKTMKISPFSCFLDLVKGHFDKVKEYYGVASLAVIKVENYNDLCRTMGVDDASLRVQEVGAAISSAIDKVHDATRITEIKIVVILPMIDKMEAADIIDKAVADAGSDVILKYKIVSYPEDGDTPAQLMFLAYV